MDKRRGPLGFLLAAVCSTLIGAAAQAAVLDGTTWNITVTPDEGAMTHGEKAFLDTIVFMKGLMVSEVAVGHGFGAAPYKAKSAGSNGLITFTAEHQNAKGVKTTWWGEIRAGIIHGTIASQAPGGPRLTYTWTGAPPKT